MLQQTFSFWRRLVGAAHAPSIESDTTCATQDDRRLWVRYPADTPATVQLSQDGGPERVAARVRDISLGGANLSVDRPLRVGQLLTLELPTHGDEVEFVLACVVRSAPEGEGRWSLGCVFSRELSHADLKRLAAEPTTPADDDDQRTWKRYDCALQAFYQKVGDPEAPQREAEVLNISSSGIGLVLTEAVEPGSLLHLDLVGKGGQPARSILACVVHSNRRAAGELAVGCNFIRELAEDELRALLA